MKLAVINRLRVTGVNLLLYSFVDEVVTDGGRVTGVVVLNKAGRTLITGDVFLDCSGDGDVAVGAGAQFLHGDGKGTFQPVTMLFRMAGVDTQKLLDFAEANPENLALGENPWLNKSREECLRELIAQGLSEGVPEGRRPAPVEGDRGRRAVSDRASRRHAGLDGSSRGRAEHHPCRQRRRDRYRRAQRDDAAARRPGLELPGLPPQARSGL